MHNSNHTVGQLAEESEELTEDNWEEVIASYKGT